MKSKVLAWANLLVVILLILFVTMVTINAGPAPDISKLYINGCSCRDGTTLCGVVQYGYALHGKVTKTWNYSSASCTSKAITDRYSIVIGWYYLCSMTSGSGKFVVKYTGGRGHCGYDYDEIRINNCIPRRACSVFG